MSLSEWEVIAYIVIIGILVVMCCVRYAFLRMPRLRATISDDYPPEYKTNQPWRKPYNDYLDRFKSTLEQMEKKMRDAQLDAVLFSDKKVFHFPKPTTVSQEEIKAYKALCEKLDRIWSGDAHLELSQVNRRIADLGLEKKNRSDPQRAYALELELNQLTHDLGDIKAIIERAKKDRLEMEFEESQRIDELIARDKVFQEFWLNFQKDYHTEQQYNEGKEKIRLSGFSPEQQKWLLEQLNNRREIARKAARFESRGEDSVTIFKRRLEESRMQRGIPPGEIFLGRSTLGRNVTISPESLRTHMHIVGATGVGKSFFLENIIKSLIDAGQGVCLITPHDELYRRVLTYCAWKHIEEPELDLARRVIPLDMSDKKRVIGFNPVARNARVLTYQVIALMEAIRKCWGQNNFQETPRLARWLYNTGYGVVEPGLTFASGPNIGG